MTYRYYQRIAAAYVKGKLRDKLTDQDLLLKEIDGLTDNEYQEIFDMGKEQGLKLHRFKITMELPRVKKVLGILQGLQPQNLLDIGTGRGVFLWPFLNIFPHTPVSCLDILPHRVEDINAVHVGGIKNVEAFQKSILDTGFPDGSFDGITFLETLEHIPDPAKAIHEVCRIARRFVIVTVPSKEDDNPEHIHLFTHEKLKTLFEAEGITNVKSDSVLNHLIVVAFK